MSLRDCSQSTSCEFSAAWALCFFDMWSKGPVAMLTHVLQLRGPLNPIGKETPQEAEAWVRVLVPSGARSP